MADPYEVARTDLSKIKNVVHPGYIYSKNDGDRHYITGSQLIWLYGLNPAETLIVSRNEDVRGRDLSIYNNYYPRYDGNYIKEQSGN